MPIGCGCTGSGGGGGSVEDVQRIVESMIDGSCALQVFTDSEGNPQIEVTFDSASDNSVTCPNEEGLYVPTMGEPVQRQRVIEPGDVIAHNTGDAQFPDGSPLGLQHCIDSGFHLWQDAAAGDDAREVFAIPRHGVVGDFLSEQEFPLYTRAWIEYETSTVRSVTVVPGTKGNNVGRFECAPSDRLTPDGGFYGYRYSDYNVMTCKQFVDKIAGRSHTIFYFIAEDMDETLPALTAFLLGTPWRGSISVCFEAVDSDSLNTAISVIDEIRATGVHEIGYYIGDSTTLPPGDYTQGSPDFLVIDSWAQEQASPGRTANLANSAPRWFDFSRNAWNRHTMTADARTIGADAGIAREPWYMSLDNQGDYSGSVTEAWKSRMPVIGQVFDYPMKTDTHCNGYAPDAQPRDGLTFWAHEAAPNNEITCPAANLNLVDTSNYRIEFDLARLTDPPASNEAMTGLFIGSDTDYMFIDENGTYHNSGYAVVYGLSTDNGGVISIYKYTAGNSTRSLIAQADSGEGIPAIGFTREIGITVSASSIEVDVQGTTVTSVDDGDYRGRYVLGYWSNSADGAAQNAHESTIGHINVFNT